MLFALMAFAFNVFVSSSCYELRDMRARLQEWLSGMGFNPILSEGEGFPHTDGMPPYASCLRTMDECAMVIGVIERQYGTQFDDWGPFPQYKGLAPTHAELRHALDSGKRVLIYVQDSTWAFYDVWRRNPDAFTNGAPPGLDVRTLELLQELKTRSPEPWLSRYSDASSVVASLKSEVINQLFQQFREREKQTADLQQYLLGKLDEAPPDIRQAIAEALNSDLVASRDALKAQLAAIEAERAAGGSDERIRNLEQAKLAAEMRLSEISRQFGFLQTLLARSAAKDAVWLEHVRSTLMPKQPGRAPFHNSLEVALRGYHASPGRRVTPVLSKVTWEKLPHVERGLHRGYYAGVIFHGRDFVPGVTWTTRRCGLEGVLEPGQPHPWMLPNIYYGDYLEVASSDDPIEGPLSFRDYEYQVRNPEGQTSEWVRFSYPFDDVMLEKMRVEQLELGRALLAGDKPVEAVEPMRKAFVFSDRMLGLTHEETLRIKAEWEHTRNEAALSKLRFRVGAHLSVKSGPEAGKSGVIERLLLNHVHAYLIKPAEGELFQASDAQVELADT
ncbi:DUF4062 domain-containing protein [Tardiphaga sp. 538_B7_N1_4]|uniref:DUF4062 domain-containing protein n=1 Tax=Tardiphaga sp. 538_B7_N1_4 TaxID=3240778 RepID=UPI001B89E9AF|nr:DUF4062 domain-containing protein [Bradyrhizobium diazoefficiens]MBR0962492.1 DUF4062 domain-containing protein [Bradyrhizobium diazoefficiens]MBR0980655.1 DUF4062 domain-containing protein [Bradyrhizobium diazoefficiens]MBR1010202.1 DUF4062 domain-containing protein [Bradyrhizobium diazoefficiens]MBR1016790.1 DUF4062 domain-containing protein [Bradyrhizobium diazoefficiens]MBR1053947.1 DUF4062 domain-containing protein [Bradyrhizobium diazoefficiens]